MRSHPIVQDASAEPVPDRTIASKEFLELRYDPTAVVVGSRWFMDTQLWTPGRYTLRAVLAPTVHLDGSFEPSTALVSNEVAPYGSATSEDDAAVMEMDATANWNENAWFARAGDMAFFVSKEHPASTYMLYVAAYLPMAVTRLSGSAASLRRQTDDGSVEPATRPVRQETSYVAYKRGDIDRAIFDADAARSLAAELSEKTRSSAVRRDAAERLSHIPTHEQLVASAKLQK